MGWAAGLLPTFRDSKLSGPEIHSAQPLLSMDCCWLSWGCSSMHLLHVSETNYILYVLLLNSNLFTYLSSIISARKFGLSLDTLRNIWSWIKLFIWKILWNIKWINISKAQWVAFGVFFLIDVQRPSNKILIKKLLIKMLWPKLWVIWQT